MDSQRLEQLTEYLPDFDFDGAIIIPGETLRYLTGQSFHLMERPVFLILSRDHRPVVVLPELEGARLEGGSLAVDLLTYAEDDASRSAALDKAVDLIGRSARTMAVEPLSMRYFEIDLLRSSAPDWRFEAGGELFGSLRLRKDDSEIKFMRRAADIAETALINTLPLIKIGMTERELAAELVIQLLRAGSEPELPFQPIVASGPNTALPHATPTARKLTAGDLLLIDWGARFEGYISDITRTFAVGTPNAQFEDIHQIVLEANTAGRAAVKPGVTCDSIDQATRQVIEKAGYGKLFFHRTGHGIGLEPHEPPYIRSGEIFTLDTGMTFTIEPGIYRTGSGGIRIEDNLCVTRDGAETLTSLSRTLDIVG